MDGENNGKPYFLMDDLGGKVPLFSETPIQYLNKVLFPNVLCKLLTIAIHVVLFDSFKIGPIQWPLMYTYSFDPKKIQKVAFLIISAKADVPILPFLSTALIWTPAVQETHGFFEKSTVYANII